jgi:hypothetical protein
MANIFLRALMLCAVVTSTTVWAFAQTNPTAHDLASGNYSLTSWASTEPALSYPPSMRFHTFLERLEGFGNDAESQPAGDWLGVYSLTSGTRIQGQGTNGFSFTNTGTAATTSNCHSVGAAVLALNTTGRADVRVSWQSTSLAPQPSAPVRPYVLRLQWRLGSSGNWQTALRNDGSVVEYRYATPVTTASLNWTLPLSAENQPLVQLRWIYAQDGPGTGSRPNLNVANLSVTSTDLVGTPVALRIFEQRPAAPSQNLPFNITVRSVDASGAPKNVTTATTVALALNTGTGLLGGTLTGTIPAGSNTVTFTGVTYNTAQPGVSIRATATSGMVLSQAVTNTFTVSSNAVYVLPEGFQNVAYQNTAMNPFRIVAYRLDGTIDEGYAGTVTITRVSGSGNVVNTTAVQASRGIAVFDNLAVSATGTHILRVSAAGLPTLDLEPLDVRTRPFISSEVVPQFIQSAGGTCGGTAFNVPTYARVTFAGLRPNTVYRFVTGMTPQSGITSTGPGLNITWDATTNVHSYGSGKNLNVPGNFSTFSTGPSETSKSVWINMMISNTTAFQEGNVLFWRVSLGDTNGRLIGHFQLTNQTTAIRLGSAINQATGVVDEYSQATPKNFIYLYDNVAGTGRPLSIVPVQGLETVSSFTETFYRNFAENRPTAWAAIVPNNSAIRRIEERRWQDAGLVYSTSSATGVYDGVSTANATGGFTSPIFLRTPRISVVAPNSRDTICTGTTISIQYNARGASQVRIEYSTNNGATWEFIDQVTPGNVNAFRGESSYSWTIPGQEFNANHRIRVVSVGDAAVLGLSERFAVSAPLEVIDQPQSVDLCLGQDHELIVRTGGSVRSFQWFKDGNPIAGATNAVLPLSDVHYGTSGVYHCVVQGFGTCANLLTNSAHVRVNTPTSITSQTRLVPVSLGETAVMSVTVEAPSNPTYQWFRGQTALEDDGRIIGTKSSRLEIRNVVANDIANEYYCVVSGVCGTARSRFIRVFTSGVFVDVENERADACVGQSVTLRTAVYANPAAAPITIQWFRNGQPLANGAKYAGVNTQELTIANVSANDAGSYTVRGQFTDDATKFSTGDVTVDIASTPTITTQPSSVDVCEGGTLNLSVTATATGTVRYQWLRDGADIDGATGASYEIRDFTAARAGAYTVRVSTACGSVVSAVATVGVKPGTTITTNLPATLDVQVGTDLTLTVAATGSGTLQYQWFKDGNAVAGEVAPTFTKANAQNSDAGQYWVRITSECGNTFSDTTTVTTRPAVTSVNELPMEDGSVVRRVVPNPVQSSAVIAASFAAPRFVTITVSDMAGQVVATVFAGMVDAGSASFPMDLTGVASGSYVVTLTADTFRSAQMISVIR